MKKGKKPQKFLHKTFKKKTHKKLNIANIFYKHLTCNCTIAMIYAIDNTKENSVKVLNTPPQSNHKWLQNNKCEQPRAKSTIELQVSQIKLRGTKLRKYEHQQNGGRKPSYGASK